MLTPGITRVVLLISGMRSNHRREQLAVALESVAGVKEVDVNLYRARATIIHDSTCRAEDAITGLDLLGIVRRKTKSRRGCVEPRGVPRTINQRSSS